MELKVLFAIIFGVLNRVRGGGFGGSYLPARALFWVAPVIGAFAVFQLGLIPGILFGLLYFSWACGPWGRWITLSHGPAPDRKVTAIEKIIEYPVSLVVNKGTYAFDYLCLLIRNTLFVAPLLVIAAILTGKLIYIVAIFAIGFAITSTYQIGWLLWKRLSHTIPAVPVAEVLTGILWAIFLFGLALLI